MDMVLVIVLAHYTIECVATIVAIFSQENCFEGWYHFQFFCNFLEHMCNEEKNLSNGPAISAPIVVTLGIFMDGFQTFYRIMNWESQ